MSVVEQVEQRQKLYMIYVLKQFAEALHRHLLVIEQKHVPNLRVVVLDKQQQLSQKLNQVYELLVFLGW